MSLITRASSETCQEILRGHVVYFQPSSLHLDTFALLFPFNITISWWHPAAITPQREEMTWMSTDLLVNVLLKRERKRKTWWSKNLSLLEFLQILYFVAKKTRTSGVWLLVLNCTCGEWFHVKHDTTGGQGSVGKNAFSCSDLVWFF